MFDPEKFINETVQRIKEEVKGKAMVALSGGVDSTTAMALVSRAIGSNLIAVHVNTGLLRSGESAYVKSIVEGFPCKYI